MIGDCPPLKKRNPEPSLFIFFFIFICSDDPNTKMKNMTKSDAHLLLLCLSFALGACKAPEPENLFNTGRDAREYNPITRQYEWPDQRRRP